MARRALTLRGLTRSRKASERLIARTSPPGVRAGRPDCRQVRIVLHGARGAARPTGGPMFARIVSLQLKPNASKEFAQLMDEKLIPVLRKQKGFKDEMLFIDPGGPEVLAISLWESRENADA